MTARVLLGDCLELMPTLEPASVDAVVTDPPYGLAFMGKAWDHAVPGVDFWSAALRVAKPGAHLVAFGGTRLFHRLACAIEDAGWEIRDCLSWLYGSGFPKSLDVSKAIDKVAGAQGDVVGRKSVGNGNRRGDGFRHDGDADGIPVRAPATDAAKAWAGWGTALKPAWEPIILARKPFPGSVADNVQRHGPGALNVDACRVETGEKADAGSGKLLRFAGTNPRPFHDNAPAPRDFDRAQGRWPTNVALDEEAARQLDQHTGELTTSAEGPLARNKSIGYHGSDGPAPPGWAYGDTGGASRFFYTAKASRSEREAMEGDVPDLVTARSGLGGDMPVDDDGKQRDRFSVTARNHHPTVKPVDLMRWLVRMVTPPGGLVLDPFCGSGSTGVAAMAEGFRFVGIEREAEYVRIANARLNATQPGLQL